MAEHSNHQELNRTSSAPNLTNIVVADQDVDADVVTPLVSELALRAGGGHDGQSASHSKSGAYGNDLSRETSLSTKIPTQVTSPTVATASTYFSRDTTANGLILSASVHSPSSRKNLRNPASGQSSSGSLHTLAEQESSDASSTVRRAVSTRSMHGQSSSITTSRRHSRSSSTSHSLSKRNVNGEHPVYPDQSFLALQSQIHSGAGRPYPILRSRSSHPSQRSLYNDLTNPVPVSGEKLVLPTSLTADNTPISSPGLFSPQATRQINPLAIEINRSGSPQLHHLQAPKETHAAEIDHDLMTGNKIINTYEVIKELGRGEHGKVKLGRDMENENYVAIKIVPRYSKHRRLGRLGEPQDQTKREVAILKKARHPNVVSLLEVIDDPNKNKVYLVLEYVDIGEIKWRRPGVQAIININNKRFESERKGVSLTLEPTEGDLYLVRLAALRHEALERSRQQHAQQNISYAHYSFEHESEDSEFLERSISQQFRDSNNPSRAQSHDDYVGTGASSLAGSMYGAYDDRYHRPERKQSVATAFSAISHMSSEPEFDHEDEQFSYVPALTQDEARRAFRDTLCGLEFLHNIGIIHRDIKPSNLLVGSGDIVKISDFGVSYLGRPTTDEEAESKTFEREGTPLDNEKELARSVGTPAFWGPELCYEDTSIFADNNTPKITGALDLWALGVTLYCMIYARLPFYANEHMGLHEAVCTAEVCCPKTRLVAADTTSPAFTTEPKGTMNSNKRVDYDLKFEIVPDTLRDLIKKLLIKDPAKRITIAEAKRHPWVIEGLADYEQWIKANEGTKGAKKILEVNEKEISHAVVKRSIIERTLTAAGRLAGSLLGRKDTRKRASSTATSASTSSESVNTPSGSNASTVGKQDRSKERRTSLRGDEVLQALHKSRENTEHHPLAQSQTASPDTSEHPDFFSEVQKTASPEAEFAAEQRPKAPDRATSGFSAAESVRTLRAPAGEKPTTPDRSKDAEPSMLSETYLRSRVEGLWEGTTRAMYRLASRDRRGQSTSRSPSTSRHSSEADGRALPSLALTTTNAAGAIEAPESLSSTEPPSANESTASTSQPTSPDISHHAYHQPMTSTSAAFEQAQAVNQRRHILESQQKVEEEAAIAQEQKQPVLDDCPPSPDDVTFQAGRVSRADPPVDNTTGNMQSAPSASTIASSIDDHGNSSVSHSQSNPSFGTASGASSPPGESFVSAEYKHLQNAQFSTTHTAETEPEFMRTADTVTEHGRPKPATASGKPLEQQHELYDDGDDENDSSDEEGIMMGGPKKTLT